MADNNCTESIEQQEAELESVHQANAIGSPQASDAGPLPKMPQKQDNRCMQIFYYLALVIFLCGALVVNVVAVILFSLHIWSSSDTGSSSVTGCYVFGKKSSFGCFIVVGAESLSAIVTLAMIIIYFVWMSRRVKVFSRFRVFDLLVMFAQALVLCTVSTVIIVGIQKPQCDKNNGDMELNILIAAHPTQDNIDCCSKVISDPNCVGEYILYFAAAFYFVAFIFAMVPMVAHFLCSKINKNATNEEVTPILPNNRHTYTT